MKKELELLDAPDPGIACWLSNPDSLQKLEADIAGVQGTPYEGGHFKLSIAIPDR